MIFNKGACWIAVVDLRFAYNTVPRDKLIALCDKTLQSDTVSVITHLLQPLNVRTAGDDQGLKEW